MPFGKCLMPGSIEFPQCCVGSCACFLSSRKNNGCLIRRLSGDNVMRRTTGGRVGCNFGDDGGMNESDTDDDEYT